MPARPQKTRPRKGKVTNYSFERIIDVSPDHTTLIHRAYRSILFREPNEVVIRESLQALNEGHHTRREIVKKLLVSDEREQLMISRAPQFRRMFDPAPSGQLQSSMQSPWQVLEQLTLVHDSAALRVGLKLSRLLHKMGRFIPSPARRAWPGLRSLRTESGGQRTSCERQAA